MNSSISREETAKTVKCQCSIVYILSPSMIFNSKYLQRYHIRERSLSVVNMFLEEMAKEAKNIITAICDEQCMLSDKVRIRSAFCSCLASLVSIKVNLVETENIPSLSQNPIHCLQSCQKHNTNLYFQMWLLRIHIFMFSLLIKMHLNWQEQVTRNHFLELHTSIMKKRDREESFMYSGVPGYVLNLFPDLEDNVIQVQARS